MNYLSAIVQFLIIGSMTASEVWALIKSICLLPAGLCVFLLGMKMMGDGLERGAGKAVKKLFARVGDSRAAGVGIGAGTTAVIQSSTATTVMVVGFVNAGVMTLAQATAVIMGANIGTTVTAFLGVVADLPITAFFMAAGAVGVFMYMFAKSRKLKCAGEIITGLAILFVGIKLMSDAFSGNAILENAVIGIFLSLSENPVGPLLLVLVGAVFTGIIQSSSATTVMVVDLAGKGYIPVSAALFIVMGANIGTCITALIAAIGTTPNAKRAALIHMMFNVAGTIIFVPIIWALQTQVTDFLGAMFPVSADMSAEAIKAALGLRVAFFHLFFNITTTCVLLGFIKYLTKLATKIIPGKKGAGSDEPQMYFIDEKMLERSIAGASPAKTDGVSSAKVSVHFETVLKETLNMAEFARTNLDLAFYSTLTPDDGQKDKIISTEQKINYVNRGIGRFLVKLTKEPLSEDDKKFADSLHSVVSDIERIGDHALDLLDNASEMKEQGIKFSKEALAELEAMYQTASTMFVKALEIFEMGNLDRLPEIAELEKKVDEAKHASGFKHIARLNAGECKVEGGAYFYAILTTLERVADHLTDIAFSIKATSGMQLEKLKQLSKQNQANRASRKNIYW